MTTTLQALSTMLETHVEAAFPGSSSVLGYYDATAFTIKTPSALPTPTDFIMYGAIKLLLETRPIDAEARNDLTLADHNDLYTDAIHRLSLAYDRLDTLLISLTAARDLLVI